MSRRCKIEYYPREYYEGDTNPSIVMAWKKDLSSYTLEMRLKRPDDSVIVKPAIVITNTDDYSQQKWDWEPSDLIQGRSHAIIRLVDGAGEKVDIGQFYIKVLGTH